MEKKKFAFQLDTPYSAVSWPHITPEDQDTMLELLSTLLSPIGHHRSRHSQPSRGRRERKRKRREAVATDSQPLPPPTPEIAFSVDIGLSKVSRSLQKAAAKPGDDMSGSGLASTVCEDKVKNRTYAAIFVARPGQPSILNSHLPQMIALASAANPEDVPIRLVGFSKACQDRLSEVLGIPRVSCIGLHDDAPGSKSLIDFTRKHVPLVEVQWLKDAVNPEYQETKINTLETIIGSKKQVHRK
ncbi:hypothetical protein BX600DRAFT_509107 [Xylariales sp. PMI_506]|nr:hypothetical protein BX600DRAFT_509107 [Xylariales sp. PMI_506]